MVIVNYGLAADRGSQVSKGGPEARKHDRNVKTCSRWAIVSTTAPRNSSWMTSCSSSSSSRSREAEDSSRITTRESRNKLSQRRGRPVSVSLHCIAFRCVSRSKAVENSDSRSGHRDQLPLTRALICSTSRYASVERDLGTARLCVCRWSCFKTRGGGFGRRDGFFKQVRTFERRHACFVRMLMERVDILA